MSKQVKTKKEKTITNTSFGYIGTVTISIKDNKNNTIITKKHHNTGSINIFKYISDCLAGEYKTAQNSQPTKIGLLSVKGNDLPSSIRAVLNNGEIALVDSKLELATSGLISAYGKITSDMGDESYGSTMLTPYITTLHFRIPYSFITKNRINGVMLFPTKATVGNYTLANSWSAYYLFTTGSGDNEEWSVLELSNQQNYNLIIDWELSISNTTTEAIS